MSGAAYTTSAPGAAPKDASMNPMAMLQAYRGGKSLDQVGQMNMPTERPAQYLPPAMAQYTPPAPTQPYGSSGGLMGGPSEASAPSVGGK